MTLIEWAINSQIGLIWLASSTTLIASKLVKDGKFDISNKELWYYLLGSAVALVIVVLILGIIDFILNQLT